MYIWPNTYIHDVTTKFLRKYSRNYLPLMKRRTLEGLLLNTLCTLSILFYCKYVFKKPNELFSFNL